MPPLLRLFAFTFFCLEALVTGAEVARPNIIFILAEDLGINDLGCYGRKDQPTPNLDRLAAQGMRFTTAFAAQPVCSPTRAALMTGKTPARLHLTTFLPGRADAPSQRLLQPQIAMQLPLEELTIAKMLHPAGYITGCLGKWQLGGPGLGPKEQGFDWSTHGRANTKPSEFGGGKGEYALTEMAEQFIDTNKDRQFFLYLAHDSPHIPLGARAELIEKHRAAFNPVYAAMRDARRSRGPDHGAPRRAPSHRADDAHFHVRQRRRRNRTKHRRPTTRRIAPGKASSTKAACACR